MSVSAYLSAIQLLDKDYVEPSGAIFVILLVTLAFVGVAIACWTTLPQIAGIDEARQQA